MSAVLIVDDEKPTRDLLATWLKAAGFETDQAESAETAITMLGDRSYAVITCDKDMPGHGGLWLVEQVQKSHPAVGILLASGDDGIAPRVSLSKGVLGYLVKPFKRELVVGAVKDAALWHEVASKQQQDQAGGADPIDSWLQGRAGRPAKSDEIK